MLLAGDLHGLASHASALKAGLGLAPAGVVECVALACAAVDRSADAEQLFTVLSQRDPANVAHRINLGVLYLRSGNYQAAHELLTECRKRLPGSDIVNFNLGITCFALGQFREATDVLTDYMGGAPDDDVARIYLARCLIELSDVDGAELLVDGRAFAEITETRERYELSQVYFALGDAERAQQLLEAILRVDAEDLASRISFASLMERANRTDEAQRHLDAVPKASRTSPNWLLLQGKLYVAKGQRNQALELFQQAEMGAKSALNGFAQQRFLSDVAFERAQLLDKLASYDDAYSSFVEANIRLRDYFQEQRRGNGEKQIVGLDDWPLLDDSVALSKTFPAPQECPIFIVGFPRSGTTLLDQLLDAHPDLQVMEEKPALEAVVAEVGRARKIHLDALLRSGPDDLDALRARYWKTVARHVQRRPGTRLVDKYPFNLARLHVAMCLFPNAQWIFAIRHPCDVVLSCFMQNLRHTEATQGFWSLEQTAGVYARYVDLWLQQRERLRPDCIDIRYEDLVDDVESNARRLLTFLGVGWNDAVMRYHEHAKTRRINTPSYNQVVQPIYRRAVGRWRHYQRWFGSAEARLAPLVSMLGYAPLESSGNDANNSGIYSA
ncbi:MAG: hypothetical protein JWR16_583 [Nevskia sp.]|nr:hypothetical protein [Nevskia sp.]